MIGRVISIDLLTALQARVTDVPDLEICGLLFGTEDHIVAAQTVRNVAADPSCRFEIDPGPLIAAYRAQRNGGPQLVGHYHSHPSGVAAPSAVDRAAAEPHLLSLILTSTEARLWKFCDGRYVELDLVLADSCDARAAGNVQPHFSLRSLQMPDPALDFASLLCSRLCHDMMSPVGAVSNGLELLTDESDPALRAQYMELLADSARASADKLKFFRLAFGAAGGFGDAIPASDVRAALEALVRCNSRIAFGWMVDDAALTRGATRILLNLGLVALDALIRGGRMDVCLEEDEIVVRAEGPRLVLAAEIRAVLEGQGEAPTSRTIGAALAIELAAQDGRSILFSHEGEVLILGASRRTTS